MKEYETVFVLHPSLDEQQVDAQIEAVQEMIKAASGDIVHVERWGRRKLAYEVKKVHEGIYTLVRFRSGVEVLQDLERRYRLREDVLRHLTVLAHGPPPEPAPPVEASPESSVTAADQPKPEATAEPPATEEPKQSETPEASDVTSSEETSESSTAETEEPPKEDASDEAKSQES